MVEGVSIDHFHDVVVVVVTAVLLVDEGYGKCKPAEEQNCMLGLAEVPL